MSLFVDIEKRLGDFYLSAAFETDGGTLGLLGPSGCGKSMTLKCIAGIERPDRGRIVLDGEALFDSEKRINLPPQRRHIGYLFQSYALFPNMTVRQNIECGVRSLRDKAERERRISETMALLQIGELGERRPSQLSGGQQQRVALARIWVSRPKLLMLDEPFSALDSHLRMRLQSEFRALLADYGQDALLVTHSRDEAYRLCAQIAVLDKGQIIAMKETRALFASPGCVRATMLTGCKNITPAIRTGEYEVLATEWGVRLTTAERVPDGVCAVGIRAHHFSAKVRQNRSAVHYIRDMEEPFEWIVQFRFAGQQAGSEPVWWRISKDRRPQAFPEELGIAPVNVLPLTQ